jgi:hypothetical protein
MAQAFLEEPYFLFKLLDTLFQRFIILVAPVSHNVMATKLAAWLAIDYFPGNPSAIWLLFPTLERHANQSMAAQKIRRPIL